MLSKRIISSIVLISLVIAAMLVDWICGLVVTLFIIVGLYEFFTMLEHKGINIYKYVGIGMGALVPLSIVLRFEPTKSWELLFIVLLLFFLIVMQFRRRDSSGVVVGISTTIFGILYIAWFFSFLIKIRYLAHGLALLATILLITKLGDIGAYLVGVRFGKTPLIPHISPKKSVEGALGGLFFSLLAALVSQPFFPVFSGIPPVRENLSYLHLAILGICLGIIGQLGDLSESLIKRDCQVKDASNIIPGMGGLLDLMDSLLFTAPVFYFYMSVILR